MYWVCFGGPHIHDNYHIVGGHCSNIVESYGQENWNLNGTNIEVLLVVYREQHILCYCPNRFPYNPSTHP